MHTNENVKNGVGFLCKITILYKMLEKHVGEGNYTLYNVDGTGTTGDTTGRTTKGKNLTFVGQGTDKTGWNIGAEVPDPDKLGTEYNGDYSFDGAGTVTFQNMTLHSSSADYLGFIRARQDGRRELRHQRQDVLLGLYQCRVQEHDLQCAQRRLCTLDLFLPDHDL